MASEEKKAQNERNNENNANNIKNAADVAIATKNPYAVAAGTAVKAADKLTGGRSTQALGKAMTKANKFSPGGRKIQKMSNRLNESGASDKIGKAAAMKNGMAGKGAGAGASKGGTAGAVDAAGKSQGITSTAASMDDNKDKSSSRKWGDFFGDNDKSSDDSDSTGKKLLKKIPLKIKLIMLGILTFFILIFILVILIISMLGNVFKKEVAFGVTIGDIVKVVDEAGNILHEAVYIITGDDGEDDDDSVSTTVVTTNFWWPIGSSDIETIDDISFAKNIPVPTVITSEFGIRSDPYHHQTSYHGGIDIAPTGSTDVNIIAAASGVVIYPKSDSVIDCPSSSTESDCGGGYGNYVMIKHSDGTVSLYGHLYPNSITVRNGDTVRQGQIIAKMGSSGRSTGTHLHFEVRIAEERVNPLRFVSMDRPRRL